MLQEEGHPQAIERIFRRNQPCWQLDHEFLDSTTVKKQISIGLASQFVVFCNGSPRKLTQYPVFPIYFHTLKQNCTE